MNRLLAFGASSTIAALLLMRILPELAADPEEKAEPPEPEVQAEMNIADTSVEEAPDSAATLLLPPPPPARKIPPPSEAQQATPPPQPEATIIESPSQAQPEIAEAVGGRAEIIIDGGFMRGADVLKALALGANTVAIGKLQGLGLSAAGTEGIVRVLELLETEMRTCLGPLGVTSNAELNASFLHPAPPVYMPSALNAFPFWKPRSPEY